MQVSSCFPKCSLQRWTLRPARSPPAGLSPQHSAPLQVLPGTPLPSMQWAFTAPEWHRAAFQFLRGLASLPPSPPPHCSETKSVPPKGWGPPGQRRPAYHRTPGSPPRLCQKLKDHTVPSGWRVPVHRGLGFLIGPILGRMNPGTCC